MAIRTTRIYKERIDGDTDLVSYTSAGRPVRTVEPGTIIERDPSSRLIYLLLDILEVLLAFRFLLRLMGASLSSSFGSFIASATAPFIQPFRGIIAPSPAGTGYVDWSVILAMIVYALVAYLLVRIIEMLRSGRTVAQ